MAYKREDIYGTSPLDIKKLNDNIKNIWLKLFGDINMADMSDATQKAINSKVGTDTVNTLIKQSKDEILLEANNATNNAIVDLKANEIASKVSTTDFNSALDTTNGNVSALSGRVTNAETSITQNANAITLKASQSSVDSLTGRVGTAESSITANATAIATKVSNGSVISTINQSAEGITINASKLNLTGVVTASSLSTSGSSVINGDNITTGTIKADLITGSLGHIDTITAKYNIMGQGLICGNISIGNNTTISDSSIPWATPSYVANNYAPSSHYHSYFPYSCSWAQVNSAFNASYLGSTGDIAAQGALRVSGSKNCIQQTENHGKRLINAYETAEYYFGDIGRGKIVDGECIITIDPIFAECVNTNIDYEVFLTKYGQGDIWVDSMRSDSFTVKGSDISFSWEIKAKRKGYETDRLKEYVEE